jgi:phosphoribosylamine--glycine ligase
MKKNILIIGSGAREHALGWKLNQSNQIKQIFFCPGNGGTVRNVSIPYTDTDKLIGFAKESECDTIVGPENPLAEGVVDAFLNEGLRIFGPIKAAARLESSKEFSKNFMKKYGIPTAHFYTSSSYDDAKDYIRSQSGKLVVKADGLASGKGVFVCRDRKEAFEAIGVLMLQRKFGDAGNKVVIEKCLTGEEVSYIGICDGETLIPLATSKDHKRALNNDKGPNTGGMGCYSPSIAIDEDMNRKIMKDIMERTVSGMKDEGIPFKGFLYAGIMIDKDKRSPNVLEFNARMGDPECQTLMVRMESDLYEYIEAAMEGKLHTKPFLTWKKEFSVCVVMAAKGYPGKYRTEDIIHGLNTDYSNNVVVFHAGTKKNSKNRLVTAGGRVLCVTSTGQNLAEARNSVYSAVRHIHWGQEGEYYRTDIGNVNVNEEKPCSKNI